MPELSERARSDDVEGRPSGDESVQPHDVAVAQADASVGGPAGDEAGLVGAVKADDSTARPLAQRRRVGARADRARTVDRRPGDVELLADPEVTRRRRR